jgi:hypothetical protein
MNYGVLGNFDGHIFMMFKLGSLRSRIANGAQAGKMNALGFTNGAGVNVRGGAACVGGKQRKYTEINFFFYLNQISKMKNYIWFKLTHTFLSQLLSFFMYLTTI